MCVKGLELEWREQDNVPRLVDRRYRRASTAGSVKGQNDQETFSVASEQVNGRYRWIPGSAPLIIEVSVPGGSRTRVVELGAGCGTTFVLVEDNLVKQKTCSRRRLCQQCNDAIERARRQPRDYHHSQRDNRDWRGRSNRPSKLQELLDRLVGSLRSHESRDELRHLRAKLHRIQAEEKVEGRKLKHIERLLEEVINSPIPSSPSPSKSSRGHRHLRHHEPTCGCNHCNPPCAPPSSPAVWQGPYGCDPPRWSIPAGKRTHKHYRHSERERARYHKSESALSESTITTQTGSSSSSRISKVARESFERLRKYTLRQSRKLRAMDEKMKATEVKINNLEGRADKAEARAIDVESNLKGLVDDVRRTELQTREIAGGVKGANEKIRGLGIRIDDGLAGADILGVKMRHVETQASMAQQGVHRLDVKVDDLRKEEGLQRTELGALTKKVETADGRLRALAIQGQNRRSDFNDLTHRVDAVEQDLEAVETRQTGVEQREQARWNNGMAWEVNQSYIPTPWQLPSHPGGYFAQPLQVDVEYETGLNVAETQRRSIARSKDQNMLREDNVHETPRLDNKSSSRK